MTHPDRGPDPADLAMFPEGARPADDDTAPLPLVTGGRSATRHRRVGRGMALAVGGTMVAVLGSGMLATGLLTRGDDPFDDARFGDRGGAPSAVVPTGGEEEEPPSPSPGDSTSPSASPSPTALLLPSPSLSASASPSPGHTSSSAPAPSRSAETSASRSPEPSASTAPSTGGQDGGGPPRTLREGDSGSEVLELQHRLSAVGTYSARRHGVYDREVTEGVARFQAWYGVRGDPEGVYGPHTRRTLERATQPN
ncbi:peptidoglycan-binding protein [Streptomyces sp. CNQ085]|uniref:peptidoglycan-binding domain-containing protein n=1 Tax=Streptomyces sp. CNQ085 TaxID=2886944 RepID=UPI001F50E65C|nr:peptidoglycan-binding protein [Streptomyces sp. CNQ085]MCI0385123.1 peptidoglycan-binding protein [Streptomyces sp. CNQ085]